MSKNYDKLKTLLRELFQLDQPDLDFGLYRIMHAKSAEVTQFLDQDLLPQVKEAFEAYRPADKAQIEKELAKAIEQAQELRMDPEQSPKVAELRARLASEAVDLSQLERDVYDHLFSFFRRYYSEGDFLTKRVYKPGVYAIPYEGEEVKLHWANADQYYIKTSEYLRDYAFRLRPDDDANPMRVHFRLVDAAQGEHGNVKATAGKNRRFKLAQADGDAASALSLEDGELVVRFTYQPDPAKQKALNAAAEEALLAVDDAALAEGAEGADLTDWADYVGALGAKYRRADGTESDRTRLRVHLDRYTARNTFDYFIHKDLGGFLRRELDFYIKNEVMHLDDIEDESAPRVEQYLSKIKVIRKIAGKLIDFLAQLEDFQKKLWLKKKFVTETSWCIRVGVIPETFYPEIAANEAQREEWVKLCAVDEIQGDLTTPGYSEKLKPEFLSAHPTLMVDTRHFGEDFTARLMEAMGDVDEQVDGGLFHSENFQALSLMQARYREQVKCIYIDPPYNTGNDGFAYRDTYQHSSWLSMFSDRVDRASRLAANGSPFAVSIDDGEHARLRLLLDSIMGRIGSFIANIVWEKAYVANQTAQFLSNTHDHVLCYAREPDRLKVGRVQRTVEQDAAFKNPDSDPRGPWKAENLSAGKFYSAGQFTIVGPTGRTFEPPPGRYWRCNEEQYRKWLADGRITFGRKGDGRPMLKKFRAEVRQGLTPSTWWPYRFAGSNKQASIDLKSIDLGFSSFTAPKPTLLVERILQILSPTGLFALDYFAGSGTTGHAVINLNREDGGRRKFILVEMGDYFDTVLLPRLKKVTFTPEWKKGKPKRLATREEAQRSPRIMKVVRLESYEDTLNNLETRRSKTQQQLLLAPAVQGPDGFKEQYVLRYMLDVETRGSQSLLNVAAFTDPTAYTLKVKRLGSDESREVNVDLLETFNWLIGLTVTHVAAPRTFSAAFQRDGEGRLRLKGRLKQEAHGCWWFRTVTGTTPDGRRTLVIWRKLTGEPEKDNLVLDEWFTKQGYSSKDSEFDQIYVNGGNNLENLKTPDELWKVRLIEEDFHRLMFEDAERA